MPQKNSSVLAMINGSTSFFSCAYRPGATNRQRRRRLELAQELDGVRARVAGIDRVFAAQREGEGVGDQRIVVNDQQRRF
jgi:hypothetical protein